MPQRIEISDELFEAARLAGKEAGRSVAEQIEHWARLGQAVERYLDLETLLKWRQPGSDTSIAEIVAHLGSPENQTRLREYLAAKPFPHFEPVPGNSDLMIQVDEDGTRTTVEFVDGEFRPVPPELPAAKRA